MSKTAYVYTSNHLRKPAIFIPVLFVVGCPEDLEERALLALVTSRFQKALKDQRMNPWTRNLTLGFNVSSAPFEVKKGWQDKVIPVLSFKQLEQRKPDLMV